MQKLRIEVDWGVRQDPAACDAGNAVRWAERGFASAGALAAGEVPCQRPSPAQGTVMDDLSHRQANASLGAATTAAADEPKQEQVQYASVNGEHQQSGSTAAFEWVTRLLAYECPLFARKFPANSSAQVLMTFGKFLQ